MTTPVERERAPGLWEWWSLLCCSFDAEPAAAERWGGELRRRHAEPQRHYHTAKHLVAVLEALEALDQHEPATMFATFFHDAIYDPGSDDNEARSADLAMQALAEMDAAVDRSLVRQCIEATTGHEIPAQQDNAAVVASFVDADLSILGAPPEVYDDYAQAIRAEYAHLSDDAYRHGRATVLAGFERRDRIFLTDEAFERWERQARANMSRELNGLANYC